MPWAAWSSNSTGAPSARSLPRAPLPELGDGVSRGSGIGVGVRRPGQDLEPVDESRAGPREVRGGVDRIDVAVAHRRRIGELRLAEERVRFLFGFLQVVPARHEDDDLGHRVAHLVPGGLAARLADPGDHRGAAHRRDHAGDPMAGRERRVGPFEREDTDRRQSLSFLLHDRHALLQGADELGALVFAAEHLRDDADRGDHLVQRVRVERNHLRVGQADLVQRLLHLTTRHGTDPAEVLREQHVGLRPTEEIDVELVDRLADAHLISDGVVDLPRRMEVSWRQGASADDRLRDGGRWIVALVGDAHEVVSQPEGVHDLGCGRQQRRDLHRGSPPSRSGDSNSATRSVRARPAVAPSSTRWSNVIEKVAAGRATTSSPTTSARGWITPSAIVTLVFGDRIGVPASESYEPVLLTAIVAVATFSSNGSEPLRAAVARRSISAAISPIPRRPASCRTGTISPRSVSTASPTFTASRNSIMSSSHIALSNG